MKKLKDFKEKYLKLDDVLFALSSGIIGGVAFYIGYRMGHKNGWVDFGNLLMSFKNEE